MDSLLRDFFKGINITVIIALAVFVGFFYGLLKKEILGKIDALKTDISTLKTDLTSKMSKLETDLCSKIDKLDARIDKLEIKIDRLDVKVNDFDKRLIAVEIMMRMKECCMIQDDSQLRKAE